LNHSKTGFEVELEQVNIPGMVLSPGLESFNGTQFDSSMTRCARIWPHENNTGGFFLAALKRKGDGLSDVEGKRISARTDSALDTETGYLPSQYEPIQALDWPWVAHDFDENTLLSWRRVPFSKKYDRLVGIDCVPQRGLDILSLGMTGLNLKSEYPKFSTALALKMGHLARSGAAHIDRASLMPFFSRKEVFPDHIAASRVDSKTMLVQCDGLSLGLGSLEANQQLLSRFPKVWGGIEVLGRIDQILKPDQLR